MFEDGVKDLRWTLPSCVHMTMATFWPSIQFRPAVLLRIRLALHRAIHKVSIVETQKQSVGMHARMHG